VENIFDEATPVTATKIDFDACDLAAQAGQCKSGMRDPVQDSNSRSQT
jgi:hypothetical protein